MDREYYQACLTDKIISSSRISVVNDVYGEHTIEKLLKIGLLKPCTPTVIDLLTQGNRVEAIILYRDIHHSALREARNMIALIENDMKRFAKH